MAPEPVAKAERELVAEVDGSALIETFEETDTVSVAPLNVALAVLEEAIVTLEEVRALTLAIDTVGAAELDDVRDAMLTVGRVVSVGGAVAVLIAVGVEGKLNVAVTELLTAALCELESEPVGRGVSEAVVVSDVLAVTMSVAEGPVEAVASTPLGEVLPVVTLVLVCESVDCGVPVGDTEPDRVGVDEVEAEAVALATPEAVAQAVVERVLNVLRVAVTVADVVAEAREEGEASNETEALAVTTLVAVTDEELLVLGLRLELTLCDGEAVLDGERVVRATVPVAEREITVEAVFGADDVGVAIEDDVASLADAVAEGLFEAVFTALFELVDEMVDENVVTAETEDEPELLGLFDAVVLRAAEEEVEGDAEVDEVAAGERVTEGERLDEFDARAETDIRAETEAECVSVGIVVPECVAVEQALFAPLAEVVAMALGVGDAREVADIVAVAESEPEARELLDVVEVAAFVRLATALRETLLVADSRMVVEGVAVNVSSAEPLGEPDAVRDGSDEADELVLILADPVGVLVRLIVDVAHAEVDAERVGSGEPEAEGDPDVVALPDNVAAPLQVLPVVEGTELRVAVALTLVVPVVMSEGELDAV